MSDAKPELSGPDLTQGVELSTHPGRDHAARARARRAGAACPARRRGVRDRRRLHALRRSARTGTARGRYRPMSVASCLLQPAHRRGAARAGAGPGVPLAGRAVRDAARQFTPTETPVGAVYVREKLERAARPPQPTAPGVPNSVVIVGGGGAGNAAAEMLRREGYAGRLTMLSADDPSRATAPTCRKAFSRARRPRMPILSARLSSTASTTST